MISQTCFVLCTSLLAHYNRWIEFLGGSVEQVGWIMGTGAIAALALRPWMGQWINRLGARNAWLAGYLIFAVGVAGHLLLHDLNGFVYVLRSCLVFATSLVFGSSLTYITQMCPPQRRTEAIGIVGAAGLVGIMLGPFLGDLFLGPAAVRVRGDFQLLFVLAFGGLILPVTCVCLLRPTATKRAQTARLSDFLRISRRHWPGAILLVNIAFAICMTVPFVFLGSYIDQAQLQQTGLPMMGLFFLCYGGSALLMRVGLRRLPDRVGSARVMLTGLTLLGAGMFCFLPVSPDRSWLLTLPALVCGLGHGLVHHTMTTLTLQSFPAPVRGTGIALMMIMYDLGTVGGAPVLGRIAESAGFKWLFVTVGCFCMTIAAIYACLRVTLKVQPIRLWGEVDAAGPARDQRSSGAAP